MPDGTHAMDLFSRRDWIRTTGAAALGLAAGGGSSAFAANSAQTRPLQNPDHIRVALVGCGNRGNYLMEVFGKNPGVEVTALCDVFGEKLRRTGEKAPAATLFDDHRQLLARSDVDAVIVATPDHWHAPIAIDAMNAGKDIYVEKPLTFQQHEGAKVIRAAQVNQRICQVGLQRRSATLFRRAKQEIVDSGKLGKVTYVRAVWHYGAPYDLGDPHEPKPADLNWERFLGQVKRRPWNPHQYHHYRLYLDFGAGSMSDLMTHWIDVVHMFTGKTGPQSVSTAGGVFVAQDDRTAPDTVNVAFEYDGFTVTFESASLAGLPEDHIVFCGTNGTLTLNRNSYEFRPNAEQEAAVRVETPETFVEEHVANFLDCCRTRATPNCDATTGHHSAVPCHLAKLAYTRKKRVSFHPVLA